MKTLLTFIALLAVLAGPALAQDEAGLDAFGIEDDGATLDQLVPDDGGAGPVTPPDTAAAPAETVPEEAAPAESPAVAPDQTAAAPEVKGFVPPADWQERSVAGYSFRFPADWQVMQEGNDEIMLFNGNMETQEGGIFGIAMDRAENLMPPGAEIRSETAVTVSGQLFRRLELTAQFDATHSVDMILLISDQPVDGSDHILIIGMAMGRPLDDYRQIFDQMMGTLLYTAPPIESETALDGLVVYTVPDGWQTIRNADGMVLYPAMYSASITVLKGDAVDGRGGILDKMPSDAVTGYATVLGDHPAHSAIWQGTEAEYVRGGQMVAGEYRLFQLTNCAPDKEPLALVLAGVPETLDSQAFIDALQNIGFADGVTLGDCRPAPGAAAADPGLAPPDQTTPPDAPAAEPGAADAAPAPALVVRVEVGGVTYLLPEGWQSTYDSAEDKMWSSPDGRFTILSFWWFPDEPLLGYADNVSVENVIVNHEPVTRIHNSSGGHASIQNVTERARGDGKRFIFTVEAADASPEDLQNLHDLLVPSLRFAAGFDPSKPVEYAAAAAALPVAPATSAGAVPAVGWVRYVNARFGTGIDYDSGLFLPQPEPENGDGLTFLSTDGLGWFVVFGQQNLDDLDARAMSARDRDMAGYDQVTYEKSGRDWYVLSGFNGGDIFYRKVLIDRANGTLHVFEITYPPSQREAYDPVVTRMAKSLSSG